MKINFLSSAFIGLFFTSQSFFIQAQNPIAPKDDFKTWTLEHYEAQGNIKSITIRDSKKPFDMQHIYFNEKGLVDWSNTASSIAEQISAIRTIGQTKNEYDAQGHLIKQTFTGTHQRPFSKIEYDYAKNGLSAIISHYKRDAPDTLYYQLRTHRKKPTDTSYYQLKHHFDAKGRIKKVSIYKDVAMQRASSFNSYKYDKNGNLTEFGNYRQLNGKNWDGYSEDYFKYDENNRLISKTHKFWGIDAGITTYSYTNKNQLSSIVKIDAEDKTLIYQETFEYNDKGLISKKITTYDKEITTEVYEYDTNGNWIGCTKTLGKDTQELKRTITYY